MSSLETPLCECGCGERTRLTYWGKTQRFVRGHSGRRPIEERFWEKVDRSAGPDGCWIWTAAQRPGGYGHFRVGGESYGAHRIAYLLTHGPIDSRLELDHLCANPPCVNPSHLEPVTKAENLRRIGTRAETCRQGLHRWADEGVTYINPEGRRICRPCMSAGQRRRRAAAREVRDGIAS